MVSNRPADAAFGPKGSDLHQGRRWGAEPAPISSLGRLCLFYRAPGGIRFLDFVVQGMQIIRGGNYWEQKDQETT